MPPDPLNTLSRRLAARVTTILGLADADDQDALEHRLRAELPDVLGAADVALVSRAEAAAIRRMASAGADVDAVPPPSLADLEAAWEASAPSPSHYAEKALADIAAADRIANDDAARAQVLARAQVYATLAHAAALEATLTPPAAALEPADQVWRRG